MATTQPGCFPSDVTTFNDPFIKPETLPLGEWKMMANGRIYNFEITDVRGNRFAANFSSGDIVDGSWDADSCKINFYRVLPVLKQEFTGYLLSHDQRDRKWRMAGTFYQESLDVSSGWYATLDR